jgi:predicted DNA-binding transcriptional regulator YafY
VPTSVNATLRTAIRCQRPVEMLTAAGRLRQVCPHALGHKDYRLKVLVFQFFGESASGLPSRGAWRSFFLDEIEWAKIIDGPWRVTGTRLPRSRPVSTTSIWKSARGGRATKNPASEGGTSG